MIEFTNAFKTSDGTIYNTLEEAQAYEIGLILDGVDRDRVPNEIVAHKANVIDILTTTKTSRPKARKINGGRKARKSELAPGNFETNKKH